MSTIGVLTSWIEMGSDWTGLAGWRPISTGGTAPAGAPVAAVSRDSQHIDLFVTGNDGKVYTSWIEMGSDWTGLAGWRPISTAVSAPAGAPVAAASRDSQHIDLYVIGNMVAPRPFYVVGHNPNSLKAAEECLRDGANALEPDVQTYAFAPKELCISHDRGGTSAPSLVSYLIGLHKLASAYPGLALVVFDCKDPATSSSHGLELLMAIREHLTFDTDINVILSVADTASGGFFDDIIAILQPREGLMIDADNDPGAVSNYFADRGVFNQGYGNGISFLNFLAGPQYRYTLEAACGIRAQAGRPRFIYVWTVNVHEDIREYIRIGVDGVITDDVSDLRTIMAEADFFPMIRLATRADNPFQPANSNYGLHIHTGNRLMAGTDAHVTLTLTGTRGSSQKTVDTNLIKRMERGEWNWVTIVSPDLGPLQTVTVQRDNDGNGPDWFLESIDVQSDRFTASMHAPFNRWIDTTEPFTVHLS